MLLSKKLSRLIMQLWILGTFLLVVSPSIALQTTATHKYGYIEQSDNGSFVLKLLDPNNPTMISTSLNLPIPLGNELVEAQASPNGRWIMLLSGNSDLEQIQIYDLTTDERRIVDQVDLAASYQAPFDSHVPVWSPDSRYVAYNAVTDELLPNIYVYSLEQDIIFPFDAYEGGIVPTVVSWSPDSERLAAITLFCEQVNHPCQSVIQTFTIPDLQPLEAKLIDFGEGQACDLNWSPDGLYISFRFSCDDMGMFFNEILIWDSVQNVLTPLTAFTNPPPPWNPPVQSYRNHYDFAWHDAQTLLVGMYRGRGGSVIEPSSFAVETVAYQWPRGGSTLLLPEAAVDLTTNPTSQYIGFRSESIALDSEGGFGTNRRYVKIAVLDGQVLNVIATGPEGCGLRWSPDGTTLAYANIRPSANLDLPCDDPISFTFITTNSALVRQYSLPPNTQIWAAGWIAIEQHQ